MASSKRGLEGPTAMWQWAQLLARHLAQLDSKAWGGISSCKVLPLQGLSLNAKTIARRQGKSFIGNCLLWFYMDLQPQASQKEGLFQGITCRTSPEFLPKIAMSVCKSTQRTLSYQKYYSQHRNSVRKSTQRTLPYRKTYREQFPYRHSNTTAMANEPW